MNFFIASISLLATSLFYVNEPVVNMREAPNHESKVASQTIFSENVNIEKQVGDWAHITTPDQYSGWIPVTALVSLEKAYQPSLKVSRLVAHVYGVQDTEFGPIKTLPYGSKLQVLEAINARWIKIALPNGQEGYIQTGDVVPEKEMHHKMDLVAFSQKFLGLPYTWGGRSSFGYDCSGFVQMLYQHIGINLLRDAKQQILDPRFQTISIDDLEPGDLIFFGKSEQKITHVGMYLGAGQFIHTSPQENQPWLRISHVTDKVWSGSPESNNYPYRTMRQLMER